MYTGDYEVYQFEDWSGNLALVGKDGHEPTPEEAHYIACRLKSIYEHKSLYVYVMRHNFKPHWYKIGVTNDVERRQKENNAHVLHFVNCADHKAGVLERGIHTWLKPYAVGKEWFLIPDPEIVEPLIQVFDQWALIHFVQDRMLEIPASRWNKPTQKLYDKVKMLYNT